MQAWIRIVGLLVLGVVLAGPAAAWNWDADGNKIDDHIEDVVQNGLTAAYENGDLDARLLINVAQSGPDFLFGAFVKYDHAPTAADEQVLIDLGLETHRFSYINYILIQNATFAHIQQIANLSGVVRVENEPMMYPTNDNLMKVQQIDREEYEVFPTVMDDRNITGKGVVIAILDSGVNDDAYLTYPGHESLIGKFVGGGYFERANAADNTLPNESENPVDGSPDFSHGSHVAGIAMGTGGPTGIVTDGNYGPYHGMAPDARLVDCKVLTDAGVGPGGSSSRGVEWCIANKNTDWGVPGYQGIRVLNMSLGGLLDDSDGTDASSATVNAAVKSGLVVCVATGNDGNTNFISAPAAADRAISVGANIDFNSLDRADDEVADFSNEGPRADDGDTDHLDEMKPAVCPTGAGVTSVEGVLTASGDTYVPTNGTSMSTPAAAGICALILEADPSLDPEDVKRILQDTAEHRVTGGKQPAGSVDPYGLDPNYHPSWGWGNPNSYAAVMEALNPNATQVIKCSGETVTGGIDVHWTTQREVDLVGFNVLRADPIYGNPGPFVKINGALVAPTGDPYLHQDDNRTSYMYPDQDPSLVQGEVYWYRIQWVDNDGAVHDEPAFPVCYEPLEPVATIFWSITHNTIDNDLLITLGSGTDPDAPVFSIPAPGTATADSVITQPGESTTGTLQHYWSHTLTQKDFGAAQVMPPSADNPWFLSVTEGGYVNRVGRIEDFSIVHHAQGGDVTYTPTAAVFPLPTVQGATHVVWIPSDPAGALNHAPVLDPIGDKEVQEGKTLEFDISASDPDGDPITYSALTLPPGATFVGQTFSLSPGYGAVSSTTVFTAEFEVEDSMGATDSETIEVRVHDVDPGTNLAPYFQPLADQYVLAENTLTFKVSALDPECDPLTYAGVALPTGATFDDSTRCFEWATVAADEGSHSAVFSVTDGAHAAVLDTVLITVKGALPPVIEECNVSTSVESGASSVGSADLGTADVDTVFITLATDVVRLSAELSWPGVSDLDITLYDALGSAIGSGASLDNPENILADNLDAGSYYFVITGFLVLAEENWTLTIGQCLSPTLATTMGHFDFKQDEDGVRLEWAAATGGEEIAFNVYRSGARDDGYVEISSTPVAGEGVYTFVDTDPWALNKPVVYYQLGVVDRRGEELGLMGPWEVDLEQVAPLRFTLFQSRPNPFSFGDGHMSINFVFPKTAEAKLEVYDLQGRLVDTLAEGRFEAGVNEVTWNGRNATGQRVAAGVYFYRLAVPGSFVETKRIVVLP